MLLNANVFVQGSCLLFDGCWRKGRRLDKIWRYSSLYISYHCDIKPDKKRSVYFTFEREENRQGQLAEEKKRFR